jgi:hypothetical protein
VAAGKASLTGTPDLTPGLLHRFQLNNSLLNVELYRSVALGPLSVLDRYG